MDVRWFVRLNSFLSNYYKNKEFKLIGRGAVEKHGSWEWMAFQTDQKNRMNRYLAVYLIEDIENLIFPQVFRAEVWAGADDDTKYIRQLVSVFQLLDPRMAPDRYEDAFNELLYGSLTDRLNTGLKRAQSFSIGDLTESYLVSRPHK
jgi:hypothetical protein